MAPDLPGPAWVLIAWSVVWFIWWLSRVELHWRGELSLRTLVWYAFTWPLLLLGMCLGLLGLWWAGVPL